MITTAALVFEQCAVEGPELDPEVVIAEQRFEAMRRAWELLPELRRHLWRCYAARGHPATTYCGA
ncbi:MAG: hypothetical protein ACKPKO_04880, partial [Candidatus Fonsibacter sp.]